MSPRIQELLKQARRPGAPQIGVDDWLDEDMFARLIICECAQWMSDGNIPDGSYEAQRMLEYFGVEPYE